MKKIILGALIALQGCASEFKRTGNSFTLRTSLLPCSLSDQKVDCNEKIWTEYFKHKPSGKEVEVQVGYYKECWLCDEPQNRKMVDCSGIGCPPMKGK